MTGENRFFRGDKMYMLHYIENKFEAANYHLVQETYVKQNIRKFQPHRMLHFSYDMV